MAKKTQQHRSVSSKNPAARTAASTAGMQRAAQADEALTEASASGKDTERPRSETSLRAVASEQAPADESAEPVRWPHLQPGAREVLGVYEQRAGELCFPGVTFESLAAQADHIAQLSENVEKARLELAAAQAAQGAAETDFVEATRRAFAYALVYAQEHPELRTELETFVYANADKPRRKKREASETQRRGRRVANGTVAEAGTADQDEG